MATEIHKYTRRVRPGDGRLHGESAEQMGRRDRSEIRFRSVTEDFYQTGGILGLSVGSAVAIRWRRREGVALDNRLQRSLHGGRRRQLGESRWVVRGEAVRFRVVVHSVLVLLDDDHPAFSVGDLKLDFVLLWKSDGIVLEMQGKEGACWVSLSFPAQLYDSFSISLLKHVRFCGQYVGLHKRIMWLFLELVLKNGKEYSLSYLPSFGPVKRSWTCNFKVTFLRLIGFLNTKISPENLL